MPQHSSSHPEEVDPLDVLTLSSNQIETEGVREGRVISPPPSPSPSPPPPPQNGQSKEESESRGLKRKHEGGVSQKYQISPLRTALWEEVNCRRLVAGGVAPVASKTAAVKLSCEIRNAIKDMVENDALSSVAYVQVEEHSRRCFVDMNTPMAAAKMIGKEVIVHGEALTLGRPNSYDPFSPHMLRPQIELKTAKACRHVLFCGGLNGCMHLCEAQLASVFCIPGEVVAVERPKDGNGYQRYCFLQYRTKEQAEMAISLFHGNPYGPKGEYTLRMHFRS